MASANVPAEVDSAELSKSSEIRLVRDQEGDSPADQVTRPVIKLESRCSAYSTQHRHTVWSKLVTSSMAAAHRNGIVSLSVLLLGVECSEDRGEISICTHK